MAEEFSVEERLKLVVDRLGFIPKRNFLMQVPYWAGLVEEVEKSGRRVEDIFSEIIPSDYFRQSEVTLPSLEQRLVGSSIAQRKKALVLDKPGTRKTIATASAVVPILEELGEAKKKQERVKTVITSPGYIVPTWVGEIEKLFVSPRIAVIPRFDRETAIERACSPETEFIIIGKDMTFRGVSNGNGEEKPDSERFYELMKKCRTIDDAYEVYGNLLLGNRRSTAARDRVTEHTRRMREENTSFPVLLRKIMEKQDKHAREKDMQQVVSALLDRGLNHGAKYYCIIDEYHNIVGVDKKGAMAIAQLARNAEWLALLSGTGIANKVDHLAYAAYVLGFVDHPRDFRRFIRKGDTIQKVRSFIDLFAVKPIRKLEDIDPLVKQPVEETREYDISLPEIDTLIALMNSEHFSGLEKYRAFRYLIANPHKLLPERYSHLDKGDDSLSSRMRKFFDDNPGLEQRLRDAPLSRMEFTHQLAQEIKDRGEKCMIVCEYQRDVTTKLEEVLADIGVRRIDQSVSSELKPIRLSKEEVSRLGEANMINGRARYRSDLSAKARKFLGIENHEIYGLSDRDIVMHEVATNPNIHALVTTRVLREGVDLREIVYRIEYEGTTVPGKKEQVDARIVRSGNHRQTFQIRISSPQLKIIEDPIENSRKSKQIVNDACLSDEGPRPTAHQVEEWVAGVTPERSSEIRAILEQENSRSLLATMFNALEGVGSRVFSEVMRKNQNALFLSRLYSNEFDFTYWGNIARLNRDIVLGLEKFSRNGLEKILDAGCGPLSLGRALGRETIGVEMNRYQLEEGLDVCGFQRHEKVFLGDMTNMRRVVPFERRELKVFDPSENYEGEKRIEDGSCDLVWSSLNMDLLDQEGRYLFLREAFRILPEGKYLGITLPSKKIEEGCREQFRKDVEACGFRVLDYFTGTYQGRRQEHDKDAERVEAYVIVAQKDSSKYQERAPSLILRPSTRVVESVRRSKRLEEKKHKDYPLVDTEYFVKLESGVKSNDPVPQEVIRKYDEELRALVKEVPGRTIDETIRNIERTLFPEDEK